MHLRPLGHLSSKRLSCRPDGGRKRRGEHSGGCSRVPAFSACPAWAVGEVGDTAPDFTLQNSAGETVSVVFGGGEVWLVSFIGYA